MVIKNFVWDDLSDNVLMETDENNAPVVKYTSEPSQFGEVLSQHRHGQDQYFHFDGLGSTRNLTGQNQTVSDSYTYTAFGETVASSGSTLNPFQFNGAFGYYSNDDTGDFFIRRRTYKPSIARWLSRDPIGLVDGPNVYCYVQNNPVDSNDPSGTVKITATKQLLSPECGDPKTGVACVKWKWTRGGPWPCNNNFGYYIQKIDFYCKYDPTCTDCPTELPAEPVISYLEARSINNRTTSVTDVASAICFQNSCGIVKHVGEVKLVCRDVTGDLKENNDWVSGKVLFEKDGCSIIGGTISLDLNKKNLPAWWASTGNSNPSAKRWLSLAWDCCPGCGATGTCSGDADPKRMKGDNAKPLAPNDEKSTPCDK